MARVHFTEKGRVLILSSSANKVHASYVSAGLDFQNSDLRTRSSMNTLGIESLELWVDSVSDIAVTVFDVI